MGLIAIIVAVIGASGAALRDRWANFWVILIGMGCLLMLGRFDFSVRPRPSAACHRQLT